jgi:hypothetical protein
LASRSISAASARPPPAAARRLDLGQPEPQQLGLAGALGGAARSCASSASTCDPAPPAPAKRARGAVTGSPAYRSRAARCSAGLSSRCWSDWPVHGQHPLRQLGQHARPGRSGRRRARASGPSAPDGAADQQRAVVELGAGVERPGRAPASPGGSTSRPSTTRRSAPGPDRAGVGPPAEQQPEPLHHHRLARHRSRR